MALLEANNISKSYGSINALKDVNLHFSENRIYFLDNLRTFMIFLVVLLHSGLVYEKGVFSSIFIAKS
jgi:hypothetical protein